MSEIIFTTDVMSTWRKYGFVPPSETLSYLQKWEFYKYVQKKNPTEVGQWAVKPKEINKTKTITQ